MTKIERETASYFKEKDVFDRLLKLFRKKFESLGRAGGTISLSAFPSEELEAISLFFGVSPDLLKRKEKVGLAEFEKRLQETRFSGVSLHRLLELYFGERIRSNADVKEDRETFLAGKLARYNEKYPDLSFWFKYLEGKSPDTLWIWRMIEEKEFGAMIRTLSSAIASLPDKVERLPLFGQRVSGNPHQFDMNRPEGKLLLHILHIQRGGKGTPPAGTEAVNDLLLAFGLLRDDITNFVTVSNLLGWQEGKPHPVWQAAAQEGSVLNMPLRELLKVDRVTADIQDVFVVENSGVFSALLDNVPNAPLICTHGQFKLAGLLLMDLLAESGFILRYSGDFDPEGLSIALRFKERYGALGRLWRMTAKDYQDSNPSVELSEIRSRKLASLEHSELGELAKTIEQTGKAGYQEAILQLLAKDLNSVV